MTADAYATFRRTVSTLLATPVAPLDGSLRLLAIDPGPSQSAWLAFTDGRPVQFGIEPNDVVLERIASVAVDTLAIESIASYGMAVGAEVFETCVWVGRFMQHWWDVGNAGDVCRVYRREVKMHLCGSARAKDANVRQALIDRYGPGKEAAIGRKSTPGVLYGVTSHLWSALAVAVTAADAATQTADRAPRAPQHADSPR